MVIINNRESEIIKNKYEDFLLNNKLITKIYGIVIIMHSLSYCQFNSKSNNDGAKKLKRYKYKLTSFELNKSYL